MVIFRSGMGKIYSSGIIFCLTLGLIRAYDVSGCKSPQYVECGKQGTVSCTFEDGFFSVYWYNSKNYVTANAIIEFQRSIKSGAGYDSGEFDVHQDGSLIINNVSLAHDRYFTALEVRSVDNYTVYYVRVFATVKPRYEYPVIENCDPGRILCFQRLQPGTPLECSVRDSRPSIALTWMYRTDSGDKNISSEFNVTSRGLLHSAVATTKVPLGISPGIYLLTCKAYITSELLMENESLLIVENNINHLNSIEPIVQYGKINSTLNLSCSEEEISFFVWKLYHSNQKIFSEISYGVYWQASWLTFASEGYNLTDAGVIVIPELKPKHEGRYACISSNGTDRAIVIYEITVYVPPDPASLIVKGCSPDQYCLLEVDLHGILECTVRSIRPKVTLSWKVIKYRSSDDILFSNQETTVTRNEDMFDIVLTAQYDATRASQKKITIGCTISGKESNIFPLTTNLDLLFNKNSAAGNVTTLKTALPESEDENQLPQSLKIFVAVEVPVIVLVCLFAALRRLRGICLRRNTAQREVEPDVNDPMLPLHVRDIQVTGNLSKGRDALINHLKSKYTDLTAAVYPVPYLRDKKYTVNDVFVESGFDYQTSGGSWESIDSFHKIFSDPRLAVQRRIIEGEAGYGKSMLSLKLAYDWCNNVNESPLNCKEIFILLQLRQLGGVKSIYEAIKQRLLPKDTKLTVRDIEHILQQCSTVLIVLDGYDEYPDQDNGTDTFVSYIINREIMQQFDVILTTRLACLPKKYSRGTLRMRLHGFDDRVRELYLRKVLVGDNCEALENVKEKMRKNPFLEDICQVPLFYVLFAHLSTMDGATLKLKSETVTGFFRHVISCFHNHGKNKITDPDEIATFECYKRNHNNLNDVAFKGLGGKRQQLIWRKNFIVEKLGQEFYSQYKNIGILVEEEVLHISDDFNNSNGEHIQYNQEVRFYHKVFCEWYAAHFLANYAAKSGTPLDPRSDCKNTNFPVNSVEQSGIIEKSSEGSAQDILENLNPEDVQYLFRFACGINETAAEKICQYVTSKYGGDRFAILCLVEQKGMVHVMKSRIKNLCATPVMFHRENSILFQKSTEQILKIASLEKIPIVRLMLNNCFKEVNNSGRSLLLTSKVRIGQLHTLESLEIKENDRKMSDKETVQIINYCILSPALTTLMFKSCLMSFSISTDKLFDCEERKITVLWDTGFSPVFMLNHLTGSWQQGNSPLTKDGYQKEAEAFK